VSVNAGTLSLTNANGLGSGASNLVSVANGATLDMNFSTNTLGDTSAITLANGGTLTGTGSTDTLSNISL